jgi:hypothetical protein
MGWISRILDLFLKLFNTIPNSSQEDITVGWTHNQGGGKKAGIDLADALTPNGRPLTRLWSS